MKTKLILSTAILGLSLQMKPNYTNLSVINSIELKEENSDSDYQSGSEIEWGDAYYRGIGVSYCNVTINGKKMHFRLNGKYTQSDFKKLYNLGILKDSDAENGWVGSDN